MNYKNINLEELRKEPKIVQVGLRKAMFVPRLLAKLSVKLVVDPITKVVTGQTYEQVKNAAVDLTMQMQEEEAKELDKEINEGVQNLSDWKEDRDYYISNLAKYKDYQTSIEKLSKKRNKLVGSPKRLLVAKNYFLVMQAFREKNKEVKENTKFIQGVVDEYQTKKDAYIAKQKEIESLEAQLKKATQEFDIIREDIETFEVANDEIISQLPQVEGEAVEPVVNVEPVTQNVEEPVVTPTVPSEAEPTLEESAPVVETTVTPNETTVVNPTVVETPVVPTPQPTVENTTKEQKLFRMFQPLEKPNNVQKVKVRVVNPKMVTNPVVSPKVEEPVVTKDETEVSPAVLGQVNSFAMPAVEVQEKASQMPLFNPSDPIPAQTEADRLFLEQMASFARQGMPMTPTTDLEAYGLEEVKTR